MADEDEQKRLDDLNERIDRSIRRERRLLFPIDVCDAVTKWWLY
jgi:hypothetical protein